MFLLSSSRIIVFRLEEVILKAVGSVVIHLPCPKNISYYWNFGSLLGVFLFIQIITGVFLSFYYESSLLTVFGTVDSLMRDVSGGWFVRLCHANGASFFFFFLYCHMFRGLYYGSFYLITVWLVGCLIFLLSMVVAFLGYVLPWGQMSFWGATVITNLFSAVPYLGDFLVIWLWGGYSVSSPTLVRFFSLHFLLPFVILLLVVIHVVYLHESGSNNPLGVSSDGDKIIFFPFFALKDVYGFFVVSLVFFFVILGFPYIFMDCDNFLLANILVTPSHIQPEWYFLAAYAVLRSVPNKLGGVIGLVMFVLIYFFLPLFVLKGECLFTWVGSFSVVFQSLFFFFIVNFILLTWIGSNSVEDPYIFLGRIFALFYFLFFFVYMLF